MNETRKNSVLIVDDENSNIIALTYILGAEYILYAANNGEEAIETAKEHLPDVILLDIVMPEMEGYDVIAALKASEKTQNIPVIFITGLSDTGDEEKGLALGAADYIAKPFSPAIVRLRVQNQIKMRSQLYSVKYDIMKYKLTSDALNIALWDMDVVRENPLNPDNKFTWSQEFRHMLGFSDEHDFPNVLQSWSNRIHPEDKEKTFAAAMAHFNDRTGKTLYDVENRLKLKNGEYQYFRAFGTSLRDDAGAPLRVAGALMDINEKKQAEEALKRRADMVRALNNSIEIFCLHEEKTFDDVMTNGIRPVADTMGLDCVCVYRCMDEGGRFEAEYLWDRSEGGTSHVGKKAGALPDIQVMTGWIAVLSDGGFINKRVCDMSEDEIAFLSAFGIKAIFMAPIFKHGDFWGVISLQDHTSDEYFIDDSGEADLLRSAAHIFANAIISADMMKNLEESLHESQKIINILSSVLNNSDAMIHVVDKDTDEILFVNDHMKRHFEIKSDVIGQHCYKVFNEGTERCDWCACHKLDKEPDKIIVWQKYNPLTKRYYRSTDRYIDWPGGKKVRIQHSVDLTDIKQMQDELEHNQKMLYAMNSAAFLLLNSDTESFESALYQSMKTMAESVKVCRMGIWENYTVDGQLYCRQVYVWHEDANPQQEKEFITSGVRYSSHLGRWESILSNGECINNVVREMPPEEQEILFRQGILSVLVVPVFIKDQFWGFASFDDCHRERIFIKEEESILRSATILFINALLRNEMVESLRDTSVQLESALEQAEAGSKAKSAFLSTISHEIRTPMNAILGVTEIQLQTETLEQNIREAFNKIYTSGDMLLGIINNILDLSKIEAGKLELVIENYDITSLISDTVQLNIMRIDSKPIKFELYVDENMPSLLSGDELRIKQILNNLLSNAFKYTEAGAIKLSVYAEAGSDEDNVTIVFSVSDTGHGMTEDQLSKLFDEYSRFHANANRTIEGTGLGMGIVKNLIHMMNGSISIESEQGKGSTFAVRLPQIKAGSDVLGRELVENLQKFRTNRGAHMKRVQVSREPMPYGRVLIVDDVETNIYVARGLLMPYELQIDSANSGFEAIEKIKSGNVYDIVFMDHIMPKMDGIEATKIIKSMGYEHPIVALTANAVAGQADMFLGNGFDDFIAKPVDVRQLNAVLNKFIRDKQPPEVIEAARGRAGVKKGPHSAQLAVDPQIAEIFAHDASKSIAVLEAINEKVSYDEDDMRMYVIYMHGMKSALANIGKKDLSAAALKLETAARNRNTEIMSSETSSFLDSLRALIEELTPKEEESSDITDDDLAYLRENLLVIKAACEEYDGMTADGAISALRERTWSQPTKELLAAIAKHLLLSDFDEIVEIIDSKLI